MMSAREDHRLFVPRVWPPMRMGICCMWPIRTMSSVSSVWRRTVQLVRVRVPTLYLQAEQDRLVRKSSFQEIHELKPDTVLASIAAPHFVLQREPRKTADLIAQFVADLPS